MKFFTFLFGKKKAKEMVPGINRRYVERGGDKTLNFRYAWRWADTDEDDWDNYAARLYLQVACADQKRKNR
jgi:hypothetical protein